jgi:hypothetical protein
MFNMRLVAVVCSPQALMKQAGTRKKNGTKKCSAWAEKRGKGKSHGRMWRGMQERELRELECIQNQFSDSLFDSRGKVGLLQHDSSSLWAWYAVW